MNTTITDAPLEGHDTTSMSTTRHTDHALATPNYYVSHPIFPERECLYYAQHCSFVQGNIVKYLWRAGMKPSSSLSEDIRKAATYAARLDEHRDAQQVVFGDDELWFRAQLKRQNPTLPVNPVTLLYSSIIVSLLCGDYAGIPGALQQHLDTLCNYIAEQP